MDGGHGHAITVDPGIELADIRSLHEFAFCPLDNQVYRTVVEYAWSWETRLTETVSVPGHKGETFLRGRNDTLVMLRRMFHCLWLVHLSRLTIRGQFGPQHFLVSSECSVRLHGVHLSRYTQLDGDMDYQAFERSARDIFTLEEKIPADIERWLVLIRRGVGADGGYLLRYYIALLEPPQQLQTFFRSRLLIERNPQLYQQISSRFQRYWEWNEVPRVNAYLHATQNYVNPSGVAAQYKKDFRGVLKLVRDFWEHPPVDVDEAECIAVLQDDFPRLLGDVHEALSHAGSLGHLQLHAIMS